MSVGLLMDSYENGYFNKIKIDNTIGGSEHEHTYCKQSGY